MKIEDAILIVGGYGIVGRQTAELIRRRHPELPLIIAGRNPAKAEALAGELKNAGTAVVDMDRPNPLKGRGPRAILAVANDPHDYLLTDAITAGIPYLDITRWTERVRSAATFAGPMRAPVMLSSAWMAGIAALIGVSAARRLARVDRIDISVLYALKDNAGPNSIAYMDRLATPFDVMLKGELKQVRPYTDPRKITFPGGYTAKAYRFDTPDQLTLPTTAGAQTVSTRIAFDDAVSTGLLVLLTRSGIWKLFSGKRFAPLRQRLLYNPGSGASHELVIEAVGTDADGNPKSIRATVADPQGQSHLTAVGALIQLERLLGLDGAPPPPPGIVYPDTAPQIDVALKALAEFGVSICGIAVNPDNPKNRSKSTKSTKDTK